MNLSPLPIQKFFDNNGNPLVGGLLFTYTAGTSTKIATYSDSTGTLNSNPIVLDYRGECRVWLNPSLAYKFILSPAGDTDPPTNPIWSADNIIAPIGFSDITQTFIGQLLYPKTPAEIAADVTPTTYIYPGDDPRRLASFYPNRGWLDLGDVPTYINSTSPGGSFSVPGDRTSVYVKGRRVRLINSNATSADVRITFSSFAAGVTTINVTTADVGGSVSPLMVAVEVQDTLPAYGQMTNVINFAGTGGAWFLNTNVGSTSASRILIGDVATLPDGSPDTTTSSAVAIVATSGNFTGSYLNNGTAGVPTGRAIWYHTGFTIPLVFGVGDQVRMVMSTLASANLVLGAEESMRFISPRVDDLGGVYITFYEDDNSTRKGYLGFANGGTNNTMELINEKASSNLKVGCQQDIWLAPAATGKIFLDNGGGTFLKVGTGTPEGVVTATVGCLFLRTDGGATTTLYVKTSGSGNTGWTGK